MIVLPLECALLARQAIALRERRCNLQHEPRFSHAWTALNEREFPSGHIRLPEPRDGLWLYRGAGDHLRYFVGLMALHRLWLGREPAFEELTVVIPCWTLTRSRGCGSQLFSLCKACIQAAVVLSLVILSATQMRSGHGVR